MGDRRTRVGDVRPVAVRWKTDTGMRLCSPHQRDRLTAPSAPCAMTLRMTLGSARRGKVATRHPAAALGLGPEGERGVSGNQRAIDDELELEVREGVHDRPGHLPPVGLERGRRAAPSLAGGSRSPHAVEGTSSMPPSSPASGRRRSSTRPSSRSATNAMPTRSGRSALDGRASAASPAMPRALAAQSDCTGHTRHDGRRGVQMRGAEVHHRLGEVAGPPLRRQRRGKALQLALGGGQRLAHRKEARHDALDVAVDRRGWLHRRRSPRSPPPCRDRCPAASASSVGRCRGNGRRARARRFARTCADCGRASSSRAPPTPPARRRGRRGGKRLDRRPAREEAQVVGDDGLDRRLLQHDLAEPDAVGVGTPPGRACATADRGAPRRTRRGARRPYRARRAEVVVAFAQQRPIDPPSRIRESIRRW